MGNDCVRLAKPTTLENNPQDALNNRLEIPNACFMQGTSNTTIYDYIPQNGEYVADGTDSSCYFCGGNDPVEMAKCSAGCTDGCCAIIGSRGYYKRNAYKANPIKCCLNSSSTIDNLTCHPDYRLITSEGCSGILKNYCQDKVFTDDKCKEWCNNNKDLCLTIKENQCDTVESLISDPDCKNFCLSNQGKCDVVAREYCLKYPKDSFCNCINSDFTKYKYNPACQDGNCIKSGYQTSNMIEDLKHGCTIMDCGVYFQMSNIPNVNFTNNTIKQQCGNPPSDINNTTTLSIPQTTNVKSSDIFNIKDTNMNSYIYIIIFIIFIIIVYTLYKKIKK